MKNYFNTINCNIGLLVALRNSSLESLLDKAKEMEKKYDWLKTTKYYQKAADLALDEKDMLKVAEFYEKMGFCYFRAAFQAQTNIQFENLMKLAIINCEKEIQFLNKNKGKEIGLKILDVQATISRLKSWIERDQSTKERLLIEWWKLKRKAIQEFERAGDNLSFGKACNDLLEFSIDHRFWWIDAENVAKECRNIGEKAIVILAKEKDDYELARAYNWTAWFYIFSVWLGLEVEQREEFGQKSLFYSKKGLSLSEKSNDAYLISIALQVISVIIFSYEGNPIKSLEFAERALVQAEITKDNARIGWQRLGLSFTMPSLAFREADPDKHREGFQKCLEWAQESIWNFEVINSPLIIFVAYRLYIESLSELALIETELNQKQTLLRKAVKIGTDFIYKNKWENSIVFWTQQLALIQAMFRLSETEMKISSRQQILERTLQINRKLVIKLQKIVPSFYYLRSRTQSFLGLVQYQLSKIETDRQRKIKHLRNAASSMEQCIVIISKDSKEHSLGWKSGEYGRYYNSYGEILKELNSLTDEKKILTKIIKIYASSVEIFTKTGLISHTAESYWQIAKIFDKLGEHHKASLNYKSAAEKYQLAAEKVPQLKNYYQNHSNYMLAWNQIEHARHYHSIEEYSKAKKYYEIAAQLHKKSELWDYLSPNYLAWVSMEEAEGLSRGEQTQKAKDVFQKALERFTKAEDAINQKIGEITSAEEKELTLKLLKASDLRRKFCQARIQIEEAKLLDKEGKYLQSSKSYGEAAQKLGFIIKKIDVEAERKELEYVAVLCQAWREMANAEETASSELYLEAARFFEQSKEYCYTRKASLWALGNSNFCRGLAAGVEYQTTLNVEDHNRAKGYIQNAATNYFKAGYKNASEYAKATLRLFDAYLFMNQAERETDTAKRVKQYQLAENLLQLASESFMEAQQPEKTVQVKQILGNVREEKELAVSFNEVLQAPLIASTTQSFTAPSPTSEASVGLEQFQHANVQANLIAGLKEVKVGESFCLSIEFVNAGREPALLTRVEDFVPPDFIVVKKPEIYRLEDTCLNMKGKQIAPLKLVEAKLVLQPSKKGVYQLKPTVHYLDEVGQNKSLQLKAIEIKVEEVVLADRVSTGTRELDSILLGGIPEEYAVVLTGPPSDERERIIKNFLEAGVKEGQTSFYVATEAVGLENLLEKPSFYLFLCNPKPKVEVPDLPNVLKLRSKTDINNLNMALARTSRNLPQKQGIKRIIVENVSDILLRSGPEVTRRWLSELITDLVSKGFTVLAVLDPSMHPVDQANAIINLFDGEISLIQSQDPYECKKSLLIKKLRNQDYIKNPIYLTT